LEGFSYIFNSAKAIPLLDVNFEAFIIGVDLVYTPLLVDKLLAASDSLELSSEPSETVS